jgi:hypothetical protein
MRITFPHSHAFPGGRLTIAEVGAAKGTCVVQFGDGVAVIAECRPDGDAVYLTVPAYRTERGTDVAARNWRLERGRDGIWRTRRSP